MTGWRQASETLDAMRVTDPAHAEYTDKLIDWCLAEGTRYACASVAAEAVRGIVHVGDVEWQVLVETFGEPTFADWRRAWTAYGPARIRVAGGATEATCQGCLTCGGRTYPCPSQTGVWYAANTDLLDDDLADEMDAWRREGTR